MTCGQPAVLRILSFIFIMAGASVAAALVVTAKPEQVSYVLTLQNPTAQVSAAFQFQIRFVGTPPIGLQGARIETGEGVAEEARSARHISFRVTALPPGETARVQVTNLTLALASAVVTARDLAQLQGVAIPPTLAYEQTVRVRGSTLAGPLSIGSYLVVGEGLGSVTTSVRSHVLAYAGILVLLPFVAAAVALLLHSQRRLCVFPIATLSVVEANVASYVWLGTGSEVMHLEALREIQTALPVSFLWHADFSHLTGNLIDFLIVGVLLESWLLANERWSRRTAWYLLPLALPELLHANAIIQGKLAGQGLSFALIAMTVAAATYLFEHKGRFRSFGPVVLGSLLLGYVARNIVGWFRAFLQAFGELEPVALSHLLVGVLSLLGALWYAAVRMLRRRGKHFPPAG